jgi:hypothetical protein
MTTATISLAQQMAFYLEASEDQLQFEHVTEDCGSVCLNGQWFDFYFDPVDLVIWEYMEAA